METNIVGLIFINKNLSNITFSNRKNKRNHNHPILFNFKTQHKKDPENDDDDQKWNFVFVIFNYNILRKDKFTTSVSYTTLAI